MQDLNGKCVIITGAAGNLGRATAMAFGRRGARLALVDIEEAAIETLRRTLPEGCESAAFATDLLDPREVSRLSDGVSARFGDVYALANIAGGFAMGTAVQDTSDEQWDGMLSLNLRSAVNCCRAFIPSLQAAGEGRIINVSARAATRGVGLMAPYCVSKAAVITLTESLADELRHQSITVNCIMPGTIDTPQNRAAMPEADHATWVPPDALAEVVVFLASHAARCITGAAIPVYGRS